MKKYLLAAAAVAALGSAAPASAQVGDIIQQGIQGLLGGGGIGSRLAQLDRQIRASFDRREISQNEAAQLQGELQQLAQLEQSYRMDGLSRGERNELQQRLQFLERRIQMARLDGDDRFGDGRFGDDRRWTDNDRRFGRNACPPGLARKNNGCMPPGQARRGNGSNSGFGSTYGDRFQDTERFIYRQDGNRIVQIDRRTGRVVRVMNSGR